MKKAINLIRMFINIPTLIMAGVYLLRTKVIVDDLARWRSLGKTTYKNDVIALLDLLNSYKEFRNVFYMRYPTLRHIRFLMPPLSSLYINTDNIGPGLFIHHGFSTVISAKSIGSNLWVNQQVTIGHTAKGAPIIGDNVKICAGAIVIGNIHIGNNVVVAAGAIVNMDVPDNALVVAQKARVLEKHYNN